MLVFAYLLIVLALGLSLMGLDMRRPQWHGLAVYPAFMAIVLCLALYAMSLISAALCFIALLWIHFRKRIDRRWVCWAGDGMLIAFCLALGLHLLPHMPELALPSEHNAGALALPSVARFDKALAAIFLLSLITQTSRRASARIVAGFALIIPGVMLVVALGIASGLHWHARWPHGVLLILGANLISTVLAEEALFRALLQSSLVDCLKSVPFGSGIALVLASVVFGLAHFQGGLGLIALATISGLVYGLAYHLSGKLSAAVLAHIGVNAAAFFLLQA